MAIKVFVMETCPDCTQVKAQLRNHPDFQLIDIGEHVRNLKEFIRLRDQSPACAAAKAKGALGIPCFLLPDGSVRFSMDEVEIAAAPQGASCSLDGTGC